MARGSSRRLFLVIAVILLVLIAVGLIIWGAIIVFAGRQVATAPRQAGLIGYVKKEGIDASLALRVLADTPDREVINISLAAGKQETALATLALSNSLGDLERATMLLTLGQGFVAAKETDKATLCFQLLANLAVLGSDFHDYQKANLLLQTGDGLRALGKPEEAEESYDRAQELARYSPALQPANRVSLLKTLADKYTGLDKLSKAQEARHAADQPASPGTLPPVIAALPGRSANWDSDPVWARIKALETERIQAVSDLIAALGGKSSGEEEARRQAVEKALLAEDDARAKFYTEQVQKVTAPGARAAVAHARAEWLLLKWRIAAQGFGVSLVPAWESKVKDIQNSLRQAYEDDYTLRLEIAALLPDPLAARQVAIDVLVDEIKAGRLGLYPNAPERGLASDLTEAIKERITIRQDDALYVVAATRNGGSSSINFAFATADQLLRKQP